MASIPILIVRPEEDDPAAEDQTIGARLATAPGIEVHETRFARSRPDGLDAAVAPWRGKIAGVVGAMRVPEARRLGELAEALDIVCFVANNNPAVWQKRRHVFHIGFPTVQTTAAVAAGLIGKTGARRYLMLHDPTEFQTRVAVTMQGRLRQNGMDAQVMPYDPGALLDLPDGWRPEVIYVVFSSEPKALRTVDAVAAQMPGIPLVLGRSLLRESFLAKLNGRAGEFWFVDTNFRRAGARTPGQQDFIQGMAVNGIHVPTTNHAFGWDGLRFCAVALQAGGGEVRRAIDYLESGAVLDGAGGACQFAPDDHNGRHGAGPTLLSRWSGGGLDDI